MSQSEPLTKPPFIHLHVHSEYSLIDGAIRIKDLLKKVKDLGHPAVALTDHGNLFAAIEFYTKAQEMGVKPIIGADIFHECLDSTKDFFMAVDPQGSLAAEPCQLVMLARTTAGYYNLVRIVSHGYLEKADTSFDGIPVVRNNHIDKWASDIICLSGNAKSELARLVDQISRQIGVAELDIAELQRTDHPGYLALVQYITSMQKRFGSDGFYIELTDNHMALQHRRNSNLVQIARHFDVPIIAGADAHYLDKNDAEAHTVLVGIKNDLTMSELRNRRRDAQFHVWDNDEAVERFGKWPDALANTIKVADACQVEFEFGKYFLPAFDLGTGESAAEALSRLAKEGLEQRLVHLRELYGPSFDEAKQQEYRQRLEYETKVIIDMGFPGYFLIVQDFINWAKVNDIPVGPGRGSGAGSLVAYALRITDLDPIPYNLIFERFLNPERVSMPDFDVDFCQDRRDEVIAYVTTKYGANNVAQITTFGKMLAKAAIRDVGRVLEMGYGRVDRIAKLIPNELGITLGSAIEREPRLTEEARNDELVAKLLDLARKIEGLNRHTSVHAAGVVISEGGMENFVPVYRADDDTLITQFEMKNAEKVGLVKFDFLGLKTLTVIKRAVDHIRESVDPKFNIERIPLDDKSVYELVSSAASVGIFQLESPGMQQLLAKLQPSSFEDIIAVLALFRPGPLQAGMVDDFVERKHGRQEINYPLPQLEPILKETYGTIIYQEQVQKIAAVLASYSLGEADLLRRAMGKKKPEEMAKQKERFVEGCVGNNIDRKTAEDLFELMAKFAEYGFNKSHTAAYGLVSYQTAYLKCHYPAAFMAAIMTCDLDNTDKLVRYIHECRRMRIRLLPPDINRSVLEFDVPDQKTVGFGLAAIKGLGSGSIKPIVDDRVRNGPFSNLTEFARRIQLAKVGKKSLELLVAAGAFDGFGYPRAKLAASIADLVAFSEHHHNAKLIGQGSLFDDQLDDEAQQFSLKTATTKDDPFSAFSVASRANEWLMKEKALLGVSLSGHPLDLFKEDLAAFSRSTLSDLATVSDHNLSVPVVCWLNDYFERSTKDNKQIVVFRLEDQFGELSPAMNVEEVPNPLPPKDSPVIAWFKVRKGFKDRPPRPRLERLEVLEQFRAARVKELTVNVLGDAPVERIGSGPTSYVKALRRAISIHEGDTPYRLQLAFSHANIKVKTSTQGLKLSDNFLQLIKDLAPGISGISYEL